MLTSLSLSETSLYTWQPATIDEVRKIIMESPSKSCELSPVPTSIIKECIDSFLPCVTLIVNKSLLQGEFPNGLKIAHVCPLSKKAGLDKKFYKTIGLFQT